MSAAPRSGNAFSVPISFKHPNSTGVEELLALSTSTLGKKDLSKPLQLLEAHWVQTAGDLRLLIQEGMLRTIGLPLRLCVWLEEELGKIAGVVQPVNQEEKHPSAQEVFKHSFDMDTNGILYYLGTQGGKEPWANPAKAGYVKVTSSGVLADSVEESSVVGREVVRCVTKADANAWFAIDFVDKWVAPTHYTLRHYSSWDTECLRSWKLEASNDGGKSWLTLREHQNDESLNGMGSSHTWPITNALAEVGYQMFRVRMTGPNSNGHLYLALSGFEIYGTLSNKPLPAQGVVPSIIDANANVKEFRHEFPFDINGILYHLATSGGSKPYVNPMASGQVVVTSSSLMKDSHPLSAVVGREVVRCVTKPEENSWICIDFLDKRVQPTHYSLRHYSSWDTEALRNWRLEGSVDGQDWTVLREHVEDMALNGKGAAFTWSLPSKFHDQAYRKFRVFQTGVNSNKHYYLALSGFEIYGKLVTTPAVPVLPPVLPPISVDARPVFMYSGMDFDGNGIINYLATQGKTARWVNPAVAGVIRVSASSLMDDSTPVTDIVGNQVVRCVTKPNPNSWFCIDLIDKQAIPTHYTLRHYSSWDVEALRNWNFEASNDGLEWTLLRKHVNDAALNAKGASHTWDLPDAPNGQAFRMFRVFQWGPNSNKHNYLALSGFELYGELMPFLPPAAPNNDDPQWNAQTISANLLVDEKTSAVTNKGSSDKWQMVRSKIAASSGVQRFAVKIVNDAPTTNTWRFIVGVIPSTFPVNGKEWVGAHSSWGYIAGTGGKCHQVAKSLPYGETFGGGDVVGVSLDFDRSTIEFFKNGVSQGVAFTNLVGPVHLAVSFTGTGSVVSFASTNWLERPVALGVNPGWDINQKSRFLDVDEKTGTIVVNRGSQDKWQSIRSVQSFSKGIQTFSIEIVNNAPTPNNWRFIIGVVPPTFPLTWVGAAESWGYIGGTGGKCFNVGASTPYGAKYGQRGDVITVIMNFDAGTIEFAKNGESQGIAFTNLVGPVFAACSMTATGASCRLKLEG